MTQEMRPRFPQERQRQLAALIADRRAVPIAELARHVDASLPTVRRDLMVLQEAGLVRRTRGGAVAARSAGAGGEPEPLFLEKLRISQAAKQRIARAAAELVEDHATVILDSGTTSLALAGKLAGRPVRIVALDVKVAEAAASGATEVWLAGGKVRNGFYSVIGSWVAGMLANVTADLFFLGADAIDTVEITNSTVEEAEVKRAAAARARRTVLIADHGKLNRRAFVPVCPVEAVDLFITDEASRERMAEDHHRFKDVRYV